MVKAHHNSSEGLNSILGESTNWKGKPDYTKKGLISFFGNKEWDTSGKPKELNILKNIFKVEDFY